MNTPTSIVLSALATLSAASMASAAISSVAGSVVQIVPPASCVSGALPGSTAFAWDEQINIAAATLPVDESANPGSFPGNTPGVLAGFYDSHFIHFQAIPGIIGVGGSVTFSQQIVGVQWTNSLLDGTDSTFGAFGTVYPTFNPLRLIGNSSLTITGNTLFFQLTNSISVPAVAQIRVFTKAVPTPAGAALLGGAGLVAMRRRRR